MTDPTTPAASSGILARAQKATDPEKDRRGVEGWVFGIRDEVAELLTGSPFDVDSYLQSAFRVISDSKDLQAAARQAGATVLGGVMLGATLQLPIGGPLGQFYLTPRKRNGVAECLPMIGYRGFFELGYRSGRVRAFDYIIRREGDTWATGANSERGKFFDWQQFSDGEFDELDEKGERRKLTGVVALAYTLGSTEPTWQFLSRDAIEKRRPSYWQSTPWNGKDAEGMYVKTPHREMAKFMQLSIASATAVQLDEQLVWAAKGSTGVAPLSDDAQADYGDGAPTESGQNPGQDQRPEPETVTVASRPAESPKPADGRTAARDPRPDSIERLPDDADYEAWLDRVAGAGR